MMNVFYASDVKGDKIMLEGQEAIHCTKVLRKSKGEKIHVVDGKGSLYDCDISEVNRQSVTLQITSKEFVKQDPNLPHLAFGLIKNTTRLEWLLEKVTEIGVSRITPLNCNRSERKTLKRTRLEKILISAMKQSLSYHLPILDEPMLLEDYLKTVTRTNLFIASQSDGNPELSSIVNRKTAPVILIGPEGDFSVDELDMAFAKGCKRVNLGSSRLRAETASVVACTILRI